MYTSAMREIPSGSSILSAYLSLSSTLMLARSAADSFLPPPAKAFIYSAVRKLFTRSRPDEITLIIDEFLPGGAGMSRNEVFVAAQAYLSTRISPDAKSLRVSKAAGSKNIAVTFVEKELIKDEFQGVALQWRYSVTQPQTASQGPPDPYARPGAPKEIQSFTLTLPKQSKQLILDSYIPHVLERAQRVRDDVRVLKLHTLDRNLGYASWQSVNLEHPASFDTLAMEPAMKEAVIRDLETFRSRRDFYRRVGRAWKRGYLLYGPPGTGKSSLVAAIANYMKFDIYDLQLSSIYSDADLRQVLIATGNRSVLVIEDIDCSCDLPDRNDDNKSMQKKGLDQLQLLGQLGSRAKPTITLSGLLNFIDGLWSSCGDERIIVFTTNHKEKLDPTLLRPGRMDMHIHMSYLTKQGFKVLANNYLGITDGESHRLCGEIGGLIEEVQVSPAQVAEELMASKDADVALEKLMKMLKRKRDEEDEDEGEDMMKKKKKEEEEEQVKGVVEEEGGDGNEDKEGENGDDDHGSVKKRGKVGKAAAVHWSKLVKNNRNRKRSIGKKIGNMV